MGCGPAHGAGLQPEMPRLGIWKPPASVEVERRSRIPAPVDLSLPCVRRTRGRAGEGASDPTVQPSAPRGHNRRSAWHWTRQTEVSSGSSTEALSECLPHSWSRSRSGFAPRSSAPPRLRASAVQPQGRVASAATTSATSRSCRQRARSGSTPVRTMTRSWPGTTVTNCPLRPAVVKVPGGTPGI
jgi:hypothetical protein